MSQMSASHHYGAYFCRISVACNLAKFHGHCFSDRCHYYISSSKVARRGEAAVHASSLLQQHKKKKPARHLLPWDSPVLLTPSKGGVVGRSRIPSRTGGPGVASIEAK